LSKASEMKVLMKPNFLEDSGQNKEEVLNKIPMSD
jgi:hypothetical protein